MPNTVYVAPNTLGTGDGSTPANAHRMRSAADMEWLLAIMATWRTELDADPNDRGLNEPHTIKTVEPGFEPGYGDKSYITAIRHGVYVRRVCWITDQGNYVMSGATGAVNPGNNTSWFPLRRDSGPAIPAEGKGLTPQDPIRRFHIVGYRSSDGKRADQVPGGTETRTATIPCKAPAADWGLASNYNATTKMWSGATTNVTKTWTVQLPSPIRAVIMGVRTPDPRTGDKTKQQWNCGTTYLVEPAELKDPTSQGSDTRLQYNDGTNVTLFTGQWYDPDTKTVYPNPTTIPGMQVGAHAFFFDASCIAFQGFEVRNGNMASFQYSPAGRWKSLLDIRVDNGRYGLWRGDSQVDIEIARWHCTAVAQKILAPGQHCQRWHVSDFYADGLLAVGDRIQTIAAAANDAVGTESAHNAGAMRFENIIAERQWDASKATQGYTQGEGLDLEVKGYAVRNMWTHITGDGGIDNKPTPYWSGWPAVAVFNAYFSRAKRAFRSWPGAQDWNAVAPHILRDVTIADARQYGVYLVGRPNHHRYVNWHNPDGRANWTNPAGYNFHGVSNDGTVGGDMDCVIHRPFDARSVGAVMHGMNQVTVKGIDQTPYRARVWLLTSLPTDLAVNLDGEPIASGAAVAVLAGSSHTLSPTNLPSGAVTEYTLTGGPGTVIKSGNDGIVTPSLS